MLRRRLSVNWSDMAELREGESLVDLQRNGLVIIQDRSRFCFGIDAVLLSGFAEVRKGETVLDLGTGTGILPLLLSAKTEAGKLIGLELQPESAEMAGKSVELNGLSNRIEIVNGDLKEAITLFGRGTVDVVVSNPPYMTGGHGLVNPSDAKAIARHEIACTFSDVARAAAAVLRPGGRFYLVHRPFRLPELMTTLSGAGLEPKQMRLVYPTAEKEPELVLLGCVKGGKPRMKVEKPLILKNESGNYTKEVRENYGF